MQVDRLSEAHDRVERSNDPIALPNRPAMCAAGDGIMGIIFCEAHLLLLWLLEKPTQSTANVQVSTTRLPRRLPVRACGFKQKPLIYLLGSIDWHYLRRINALMRSSSHQRSGAAQ
jgi:hypothetical protein